MEPLTRIEQIMKGPPSRTSLMLKQLTVLLTTQSHYRSQRGNKLEMGHWWNLAHFLWQLHIPIGLNVQRLHHHQLSKKDTIFMGKKFAIEEKMSFLWQRPRQPAPDQLLSSLRHNPTNCRLSFIGARTESCLFKSSSKSLLRLDVGEHLVWELLASLQEINAIASRDISITYWRNCNLR